MTPDRTKRAALRSAGRRQHRAERHAGNVQHRSQICQNALLAGLDQVFAPHHGVVRIATVDAAVVTTHIPPV
jgi:hypothetical protein